MKKILEKNDINKTHFIVLIIVPFISLLSIFHGDMIETFTMKLSILLYIPFIISNIIFIFANKKLKYYIKYLSIFFAFATYFLGGSFSVTYLYIILFSMILTYENKDRKIYLSFIVLGLIFFISLRNYIVSLTLSSFLDSTYVNLMPLLIVLLTSFIIISRRKERENVKKLNEELKKQNTKLQDYANKVEDLAILTERTRVAQELHDSLGHYLMAISMHVDMLEKVKSSPDKLDMILNKTKDLVKSSIKELRATVFELKEVKNSDILSESINELCSNLSTLGEINFDLEIDNNIEAFTPFIKDIIYKTIKESITNGLKHGNAKYFKITISISDKIYFSIENDGSLPESIEKSNGVKGIEERLALARGTAKIEFSDKFKILCQIPIKR